MVVFRKNPENGTLDLLKQSCLKDIKMTVSIKY